MIIDLIFISIIWCL